MGNCLRVKLAVEDAQFEEVEHSKTSLVCGGKITDESKKVSFDLGKEGGARQGDSREGVVRIRVVLTQQELKQLLNLSKDSEYSSVEHLVRTMKKRSMRVSDGEINESWRPALASIPEDH